MLSMNMNEDERFFNHIFSILISALIISCFSYYAGFYPDNQPQIIEVIFNLEIELSIFIFLYCFGYIYGIGCNLGPAEIEKIQVELIVSTMLLLVLVNLGGILTGLNNQGLGLY